MPDNETILLLPIPYPGCNPVEVTVRLWLAPLQEACDLPDLLWQEWSDVIADGAASRLLAQPKQDYTNMGLAARLFTLFTRGVTRAKNRRVMQRTTGPLMMRGSYF
jgi:hypothetical protein